MRPAEGLSRYRFLLLLIALILVFLSTALLRTLFPVDRLSGIRVTLAASVFTALLLSAVYAVSTRRNTRAIAGTIIVIVLILRALAVILDEGYRWLWTASDLLGSLFLLYICILVLKHVFVSRRVTQDLICASLCVYLLIGVMWAGLYSAIDHVQPGSFTQGISSRDQLSVDALYFSFTTLTTLGYGDIGPVTPWARMLAAIEAIIGQIYLAVLVARLVGLHISQAGGNDGSSGTRHRE